MLLRTETVSLRLPRCERCRPLVNPRVISTLSGVVAGGLAVGALFTNFNGNRMGPFVWCLGAAFVVAIVAAVWPREARVVRVDRPFVWLAGFSPEYLATLPPYSAGPDH